MSEKQLDIHELIQLSHISEVRDIIALKVEELKTSKARKLIEDYRLKKNTHKQLLFENVVEQEKITNNDHKRKQNIPPYEEEPRLYWFVLTQYKPWMWQVTEMEPEPRSYEQRLRLLPSDIIEHMAEAEINPVKINQPKPLYSNDSRCFYDVKYVRFSSNNLFGVVRENLKLKNEMYAKIKVPPDKKMEAALDILFYCISKYPVLARMFIDGMFEVALPYLAAEERLKEVTALMEKSDKDQ